MIPLVKGMISRTLLARAWTLVAALDCVFKNIFTVETEIQFDNE